MNERGQKNTGQKKRRGESFRICRETLGFMAKTAWREKPVVFLVLLMRLTADLTGRAREILLPKFLMDELVLLLADAEKTAHIHNVILYAAIGIGVRLLEGLLTTVADQTENVAEVWLQGYIDRQIGARAMEMDFEHTEDPDALDVKSKAQEGMTWYSGGILGVLNAFYRMLSNVLVLCGAFAVVAVTCPALLPVQLIALLLMLYLNMKKNQVEVDSFLKLSKSNRIFGYVFFQLTNIAYAKDIRLYDGAPMMGRKMDENADKQVRIWMEQGGKTRTYNWGMDMVNTLRDGLSYFYIGYLAILGRITLGDFSMCVASASALYQSLFGIAGGIQDVVKRCNYAHRYLEFMDYPAAMEAGTRPVEPGEHTVTFSHVSFRYPRSEEYVLRDIDLTLKPGEHLSVVGLNGAGKTTFIKLLCRLYDVTEGAILIDGINIKEYSREEYRKLFGAIFQDFTLFAFSLKENIALEKSDGADRERLDEVLSLTGLYEDAYKLPDGIDTMIYKSYDENGTELSGGQQQKTAIARALYRDAPIVILDEPTAALDPLAEYEIYRQFGTLVGGKTAIYISHRLSSCRFCDRIAVFSDGTIREYGTHEELAAREGGIYAEMFREQAKYYEERAEASSGFRRGNCSTERNLTDNI